MGGAAQYTDEEILWILNMKFTGNAEDEHIQELFPEQFNRPITVHQVKYVRTKYAKAARFNVPNITNDVRYFTRQMLEQERLPRESRMRETQEDMAMVEQDELPQEERSQYQFPLEQQGVQHHQSLPDQTALQYQNLFGKQISAYQDLQGQQNILNHQDAQQQQQQALQYQGRLQDRQPSEQNLIQHQETQFRGILQQQGRIEYPSMQNQALPRHHQSMIEGGIESEPRQPHDVDFSIEGRVGSRTNVEAGHSPTIPPYVDVYESQHLKLLRMVAGLPLDSVTTGMRPTLAGSLNNIQANAMYFGPMLAGQHGQQAYTLQRQQIPMPQMLHPVPQMQVLQSASAETERAKPTRQRTRKQIRQVAEYSSTEALPTSRKGTRGRKRKRGSAAEPESSLDFSKLQSLTPDISHPSKMAKLSYTASSQAAQTWPQTVGNVSAQWAQDALQFNPVQCYMNEYTPTGLGGPPMMQNNPYALFPTVEMAPISGPSQPQFRPVRLLDDDSWLTRPLSVTDEVPQPLKSPEIGGAGAEEDAMEVAQGALAAPLEAVTGDERANASGDVEKAGLPSEEDGPEPFMDDLYADLDGNEVGVGALPDLYDFEPSGGVHVEDPSTILTADECNMIDFLLATPMTEEEARQAEEIINATLNNTTPGNIEGSPTTEPTEV